MIRRGVAILAAVVSVLSFSSAASAAEQSPASAPGASYFTITSCRVVDTRTGRGGPTLTAGQKRIIQVTGACAIPSNAFAVALNVTVVNPMAFGNARLFPGDGVTPSTSTLNFSPGQVRANNAIVRLAVNGTGTIALLNSSSGSSDYVIDLVGYFACASIVVAPPGPALPAAATGTPYSQTFTASGGSGSYAFTVTSGTPPAGLTLSSAGVLSGTPTQTGDFSFAVTAMDMVSGCVGATAYTLHVACGTLTVGVTPTPAQVCAGSSGNGASATAGFATYAWTITNGTIVGPTNTQSITYTAGTSGSVGLTVNVTDALACPGQGTASVPINASPATPTILTANPQTFTVSGTTGTFTLTFNGQTTSSLAFNATAASVQAALNALSSIGGAGGTVAVTQAGSLYTVAFGGSLTGPQPSLTASASGGCTVVVNPFSVCADSTGNLAVGPAGATTYVWTITNGTITSATDIQTITYTAGPTGPITLTLTVTNAVAGPGLRRLGRQHRRRAGRRGDIRLVDHQRHDHQRHRHPDHHLHRRHLGQCPARPDCDHRVGLLGLQQRPGSDQRGAGAARDHAVSGPGLCRLDGQHRLRPGRRHDLRLVHHQRHDHQRHGHPDHHLHRRRVGQRPARPDGLQRRRLRGVQQHARPDQREPEHAVDR